MMNSFYHTFLAKRSRKDKMLAVLLDPEKCRESILHKTLMQLRQALPDVILIGGSSKCCPTEDLLSALSEFSIPKILFPGDTSQFSEKADGMLLLSLISGRNPEYLIGQHVKSALKIKASRIETIPTGYILIDGGTHSSVSRVSETQPIKANDIQTAVSTALAGELLGMKMIYLEAGSGALHPVHPDLISEVKKQLDIPLIVGGGIKTDTQLQTVLNAGADLVVVGNIFESKTERINAFIRLVAEYNHSSF